MTTQALIYENATPVSKARHAKWSVKTGADYSFARRLNAVPLTVVEFAAASREFPIVFVKSGDTYTASALLGLRDNENLFVGEDGQWLGKYVPAFIRRYPFVLAQGPKEGRFTLCIDETSELAGEAVDGEQLFDDEGVETTYFKDILGFNTQWERASQVTAALCKRLMEHDLLDDVVIRYPLPNGQKASIQGFATVDKEKLQALGKGPAQDLLAKGDLESVYAHLLSLRSVEGLSEELTLEPRVLN